MCEAYCGGYAKGAAMKQDFNIYFEKQAWYQYQHT